MKRYAVYYAPEPGAFADAAASWLGWDPVAGQAVAQPDLGVDLARLTAEPRKYGFHGTIKAPFRLAGGDVVRALQELAAGLAPVQMAGLDLVVLERFLALVPRGDTTGLQALAGQVVLGMDPLRAPLTEAEIARRRPERLNARQRELLDLYGYPYVLEQFQFHLTLSGPVTAEEQAMLLPLARAHLTLPEPFVIRDLCLFGEAEDGRFHLMHRCPLGG